MLTSIFHTALSIKAIIGAFVLFMSLIAPSFGLQIERVENIASNSGTILRAIGPIVTGDAIKLQRMLEENPPSVPILMITSPGGAVDEAMRIGQIIQQAGLIVSAHGECASACAQIIFPSGNYSILTAGSVLGFHSCSTSDGTRSDLCNEVMAKYVTNLGYAYGTMMVLTDLAEPDEVYWVTEIGARCWGWYRGADQNHYSRQMCVDSTLLVPFNEPTLIPALTVRRQALALNV